MASFEAREDRCGIDPASGLDVDRAGDDDFLQPAGGDGGQGAGDEGVPALALGGVAEAASGGDVRPAR